MGLEIAQRENPEIVITDLSMPLMRGDEMIRAIRADKTIRQPFIVATSGDDEGRYLIQLGANMFLLKPYQPAQAIQQGLDSLEPKHA
jgi:two-component system KDP operon response regulator KdpE